MELSKRVVFGFSSRFCSGSNRVKSGCRIRSACILPRGTLYCRIFESRRDCNMNAAIFDMDALLMLLFGLKESRNESCGFETVKKR